MVGSGSGGIIKLKTWQQAAVALGSAVGALLDPRRADLIAALGETTGKPAFQRVLQRMKSSPQGRVSNHFMFFFSFNSQICSLC
jgi:ubiquinone biosynthesis protein COQ4